MQVNLSNGKPASGEILTAQPLAKNSSTKPSLSQACGLIFPVSKILQKMKQETFASRISTESAIGVASALEYLTAEILDSASDFISPIKDESKKRIKPRHIAIAVEKDEELKKMIGRQILIPMRRIRTECGMNVNRFRDDMAEEDIKIESEYDSQMEIN